MKRLCKILTNTVGLLALFSMGAFAQVTAVPPLMNFQGRLAKPDGTPVVDGNYSVRFSLWTAPTGGVEKWSQTITNIAVRNGVFAVLLNLGSGFENGATAATLFNTNLSLEIKVGNAPALTPRQQLGSVAFAMKANSVKDGSITGASLATGTITADKFAQNLFNPLVWLLDGNRGAAGRFLGMTDNQPLELRVNNRRAMRYQFAESIPAGYRSINVLGGSEINQIGTIVVGATIAGGGLDSFTDTDAPNIVFDDFGAIGGGYNNIAGFISTIGGGFANSSFLFGTVGGGVGNTAFGISSTVAGGGGNTAGDFATAAGGVSNNAFGDFSFAAGRRAQANDNGTFVWGDSTDADIASTSINQFVIRAGGGVKLSPETTLELGFGVAGKNANAGQIGYATFTSDTLDIVGAGTSSTNRKVKIWAEGGLTSTGVVSASGFNNTSDARYKHNIATFDNALDTILNLRGVTFEWNRDKWKERGFAEGRQIGFIAQEVEKVLPELVSTDSNGYKSVAYVNVVPVLVEAIKQHQKQIDAVKRENEELRARLKQQDAQQAQIEALQRRLDAMQAQREKIHP